MIVVLIYELSFMLAFEVDGQEVLFLTDAKSGYKLPHHHELSCKKNNNDIIQVGPCRGVICRVDR